MGACIIPLKLAGSVSGKVGSHNRFANSQASALNAGVSTDPYLPESKILLVLGPYLISKGVVLLVSLLRS